MHAVLSLHPVVDLLAVRPCALWPFALSAGRGLRRYLFDMHILFRTYKTDLSVGKRE